MAERIKKGFFKVLPLSVVVFLVLGLVVSFTMPTPQNLGVEPVKAAVNGGTTSALWLLDTNATPNGKIDRITFSVLNTSGDAWALNVALPYGLSVTQAGNAITISAVTITSIATANPITVQVDLDESDADLLVNTDGVTTGAIELIYTPVLFANCGTTASICDTDEEMNVIATGDTGATDTEVDKAAPYMTSATYGDSDAGGNVDRVTFVFSESTTWTAMTAADWAFGAGDIAITGDFLIGDCTASPSITYVCTDAANAHITSTADRTGKQTLAGIEPTFTYTNSTNDINDGAAANNTATFGPNSLADGAAPYFLSAIYSDSTADGKVDRVAFAFSEVTTFNAITAADWAFGGGDIVLSGDFALAECVGSATLTTVTCTDAGTGTVDATASRTGKQTLAGIEPTITYTNGTNDIRDASSNNTATFGPTSLVDGAAPVFVTTSPADGATGVALDASMVITFSETMTEASVTGAITRAPAFTLGTASWNAASIILTYSAHDAFAGMQNYIITLAGTIASAAATDGNLGTGPVANPFDFTTVAASSGGGGAATLPASITVTTPNGGEILTGGGTYSITWSAVSNTDPVSIYYSTDSGINFLNTIATDETNDGSYTWTVPNVATSAAKVKVVSGSLNDISDSNFTITYSTSAVSTSTSTVVASPTSVTANGTSKSTVTVTVKDSSSNLLSGKVVTLASSRGTSDTVTTVTGTTGTNGVATFEVKSSTAGTSTYTATAAGVVLTQTASVSFAAPGTPGETPVSLSVGDLIKSSLSSSVYYYGSDGKRHVFPNEKTYKSWYVDFTGIKTISASQLQGITLGKNVTVRPGTVLVKIQTDPKVYAVEPGGLLRWVPTEARATTLYGSSWASKIIDVPVIFWVDYTFGTDITTDKHPTGALVQYTGSTEKYYIQGTEKRLISTAGFTANKFQLSNVLTVPTTITYTTGTALSAEETALSRIY
ncbi:MAG: invasin domain 3-containing protein [Patescibacteria group bacterium]|jgi:hypothetical protein